MVAADGSGDLTIQLPPIAIEGSLLLPEFTITGSTTDVFPLWLPGEPENDLPGSNEPVIMELFANDGENILQVTNFRRTDTGENNVRFVSRDEHRVLFIASADPFGSNPFENCQIFSVGILGDNLRQLTEFDVGERSEAGCTFFRPGCAHFGIGYELSTDTALFYSTCDPLLGTNANGGAIFAMQFDGTDLRQLTNTVGMVTEDDGTVTVTLPGPVAYPQAFP